MDDMMQIAPQKPAKLVPVLIGAAAMAVIDVIPGLNLINLLCCAGVMGAAVLGVWFYRKGFAQGSPFTVGDGALVGLLSGLAGGALASIVQSFQLGLFTGGTARIRAAVEEVFAKGQFQGMDAAQVEQIRQSIDQMLAAPALLFAVLFFGMIIVHGAFGTLGGLIGGAIFKTREQPLP